MIIKAIIIIIIIMIGANLVFSILYPDPAREIIENEKPTQTENKERKQIDRKIDRKTKTNDMGGLKEWNTDMPIDADFILDDEAQTLADEAKNSSVCIPIGEGENCW